MWLNMLTITLPSQNKVNTFVLLEMNCKINSIGGAKLPYFVYK